MIRQHSDFLVTERFVEIRASVDYDTERLLQELGAEEADEIARLTGTRDEFFRNLAAVEERESASEAAARRARALRRRLRLATAPSRRSNLVGAQQQPKSKRTRGRLRRAGN